MKRVKTIELICRVQAPIDARPRDVLREVAEVISGRYYGLLPSPSADPFAHQTDWVFTPKLSIKKVAK